jgi:Gluconate 2-dehydrogenase subunit 3
MNSRRELLITIAGATTAVASAQQQPAQQHHHADTPVKPGIVRKAAFFSAEEFSTLGELCDLIIPRTDTPGASDAGVHILIEERMQRNEEIRGIWREGLAKFRPMSAADRISALTAMSKADDRFFVLLKSSTVEAYYGTYDGLVTELGWHGNVALTEFKGCTHKEHQA